MLYLIASSAVKQVRSDSGRTRKSSIELHCQSTTDQLCTPLPCSDLKSIIAGVWRYNILNLWITSAVTQVMCGTKGVVVCMCRYGQACHIPSNARFAYHFIY